MLDANSAATIKKMLKPKADFRHLWETHIILLQNIRELEFVFDRLL
jgi:hypothetical protein